MKKKKKFKIRIKKSNQRSIQIITGFWFKKIKIKIKEGIKKN